MLDSDWMRTSCGNNPVKGFVAGALGGLAGAWAMNQLMAMRAQRPGPHPDVQPEPTSKAQEQSNLDEAATVKTAQAVSRRLFDHDLTDQEKRVAEPIVHYGYGAILGGVYGAVTEVAPALSAGLGMPFGAAAWLLGDEVAVPALGLSKGPTEYGPRSHADALASHFCYGLTTDLLRRVFRNVL